MGGWVGGLQGGVEGVGHGVFFVGGLCGCSDGFSLERVSVLRFVVVGQSGGVEAEDGVALELLFQVWSRPGRQERRPTNTSQDDGTTSRSNTLRMYGAAEREIRLVNLLSRALRNLGGAT